MFTIKMVVLLVLSGFVLAACGNTISGVGKDISDVGAKVTTWQNTVEKKDEK